MEMNGFGASLSKTSFTDYQPFNRLNVRQKKEIISVGLDHINPAVFTGPEIEPRAFKAMLDRGEPVHVLDTRNDYELRIGTFDNAIDLNIGTFRAFPEAVSRLPDSMKDEPVVMFCTGGIRCEKASAIMLEAGFTNVRQLKGGVLGYFEEVGGAHWDGDCFVFDQRVAPSLEESDVVVCFAVGSVEEQASPDYEIGSPAPTASTARTWFLSAVNDNPIVREFPMTPSMPFVAVNPVVSDHPRLGGADDELAVRDGLR